MNLEPELSCEKKLKEGILILLKKIINTKLMMSGSIQEMQV